MPQGDRTADIPAFRPLRRILAAGLASAPLRLFPFLLVALAFALAAASAGRAEDVPIPRISPLMLQGDAGADPGPGDVAGSGDVGGDVMDEPIDTALVPPSTSDGAAAGFLDLSGDADVGLGAGGDQPLPLAPLDLKAAASAGPLDPPGDGPIDLNPARPGETFTTTPPADSGVLGTVTIDARLIDGGPPIPSGVVWRVFGSQPMSDGKLRLVGEAEGGAVTLKLRPGNYMVHAAYGHAGLAKKVTVTDVSSSDTMTLNAGGLRLTALVGDDQPLPANEVNFDIYAPDDTGPAERVLLVEHAPPSHVISLNAGIYHVVCHYGDANAVVRADIKVEPGKLTEAAVYQKAARLTLKLVEEHGGEALANTSWSVMTPAGDSIVESVGAFPSVVLAAGDYTAVAKHNDNVFRRDFTVEAGINRDVEVLAH